MLKFRMDMNEYCGSLAFGQRIPRRVMAHRSGQMLISSPPMIKEQKVTCVALLTVAMKDAVRAGQEAFVSTAETVEEHLLGIS